MFYPSLRRSCQEWLSTRRRSEYRIATGSERARGRHNAPPVVDVAFDELGDHAPGHSLRSEEDTKVSA